MIVHSFLSESSPEPTLHAPSRIIRVFRPEQLMPGTSGTRQQGMRAVLCYRHPRQIGVTVPSRRGVSQRSHSGSHRQRRRRRSRERTRGRRRRVTVVLRYRRRGCCRCCGEEDGVAPLLMHLSWLRWGGRRWPGLELREGGLDVPHSSAVSPAVASVPGIRATVPRPRPFGSWRSVKVGYGRRPYVWVSFEIVEHGEGEDAGEDTECYIQIEDGIEGVGMYVCIDSCVNVEGRLGRTDNETSPEKPLRSDIEFTPGVFRFWNERERNS